MGQFWKDVLLLMQAAPDGSKLHDVARLEYVVTPDHVPDSIQDPEHKVSDFNLVVKWFSAELCLLFVKFNILRQKVCVIFFCR